MISRLALSLALASWLLGCDGDPAPTDAGPLPDGARTDAGVTGADGGVDDAGGGVPGEPRAVLVPAPPAYFYLDDPAAPLTVGGVDVTHYRAGFSGETLGAETAVATALSLADAAPGWQTLELVGRDAAGTWQTVPTTYRLYVATTRHEPVACTLRAAGGECDLVIDANADHEYWASADAVPARAGFETLFEAPPGSTICLGVGTHRSLSMRGVHGSEDAPYTFVNCGGVARFALNAGDPGGRVPLKFSDSHHLRIVGTGSSDTNGLLVASGGTTDGNHALELSGGSSDAEIAFVEVESSMYAGIVFRTDVTCAIHRDAFVQRNTFIHDTTIHDTLGEGFYLGGSHWNAPGRLSRGEITCGTFGTGTIDCSGTCAFEHELHGVRIYRNRIDRTDADGLQISSAPSDLDTSDGRVDWDTEIWGNVLHDVAIGDSPYNSGGMSIQAGVTGRVHHNYVEHTLAYAGVFLGSPGHLYFYDNVIVALDGGADGTVGLGIQDNTETINGPFFVVGNTIVSEGAEGVYMYHQHSTGNRFVSNMVIGAAMAIRLNSATVDWTATSNVLTGTVADHFADMGEDGWHLLPTSSAVGAGEDLSGFGVTDDFHGTPRTAPHDVGAVVTAE